MRVRWLGHATVELESGAGRLLTDPVLRTRIAHLRRRVPPAALPERLDAILISHGHQDHLDLPSLRQLDPAAVLVVPAGLGGAVRRAGREVVELAVGESTQAGGMHVTAVPAVHAVRRVPLGPATGAVGFVIAAGVRRVYFAGDTALFDGLAELGPIDLALLPVWGWGFSLGPGHMDPDEAARAAELLRPAVAVPIHWGTLLPVTAQARHAPLLHEPPRRFARAVASRAPATRVVILEPGEALEL